MEIDVIDETQCRIRGLQDLLRQVGDPEAKLAAGAISKAECAEARARQLAYTAAIGLLEKGEEADMDELLERMREVVAQPTQEEINAADIAYLLMIGGED